MIDVNKTLTGNDGFVQVDNIVFTMYPLLDGFSVETAGLYAYLCSWKQNNPEHPRYNCVWLTQKDIMAQAGIGRSKFERYIAALNKYALLNIRKSDTAANKDVYQVLEPLTEAEFRSRYPKEIEKFSKTIAKEQERIELDKLQFKSKRLIWKAD